MLFGDLAGDVSDDRAASVQLAGMFGQPGEGVDVVRMPVRATALQAPVLYTVPLQLLAYHVAVLKGTDVDQPRNLAKSVTVE